MFTREGLRGASMERIAAEAGVARATVYAYFTDKEDAFRHVSQRLAGRLVEVVTDALAEPGTPEQRIRNAIVAKHLLAWRVARASPHAADLLEAKDRLAGPIFTAADAQIVIGIAQHMAKLGVPDPKTFSDVVLAAAKGVAGGSTDEQELTAGLGLLLSCFIGGLLIERAPTD